MRVLVACEFSGVVRDAFTRAGHYAASCDPIATERPGPHYQTTLEHLLGADGCEQWDLLIAHPPCTHLAVSGARWFKHKRREQLEALAFVWWILALPIPRICIENPISIISSRVRRPDQIVEPFWFGHREFKRTCLWLKGLPKLTPTDYIEPPKAPASFLNPTQEEIDVWKEWNRVHREPPGPDRWKNRSRTFTGIADAMARQWGAVEDHSVCDAVGKPSDLQPGDLFA